MESELQIALKNLVNDLKEIMKVNKLSRSDMFRITGMHRWTIMKFLMDPLKVRGDVLKYMDDWVRANKGHTKAIIKVNQKYEKET
jgi:hypothetical protein